MKNILFGLMAVTSVAFAGQPNLGADTSTAPAGTVFQTGQKGEIAVHGKLQANPEIIKYVVFASTDGNYTGTADQEVWKWSDYTIVSNTNGKFDSTNSKVYVKKVNSSNNGVEELTTEVVSYKLNLDPYIENQLDKTANFISYTSKNTISASKTGVSMSPIAYFTKSVIDELTVVLGSGYGFKIGRKELYTYFDYFSVAIISESNGRGVIFSPIKIMLNVDDQSLSVSVDGPPSSLGTPSNFKEVEEYFATPKSAALAVSISVKVN